MSENFQFVDILGLRLGVLLNFGGMLMSGVKSSVDNLTFRKYKQNINMEDIGIIECRG